MRAIQHQVYYYELRQPCSKLLGLEFPTDLEFEVIQAPHIERYRRAFHAVGAPWRWTSRTLWSDEKLQIRLSDPLCQLFYLKKNTEDIGFVELYGLEDVEICFMGVLEKYIGCGIGPILMSKVQNFVFSKMKSHRLWLHTCEFDHPKARKFYESTGFLLYDSQIEEEWIMEERIKEDGRKDAT